MAFNMELSRVVSVIGSRVDHSQFNDLPIVTSGGRSNTQDCSVHVQLPHVGRLLPVDSAKGRGSSLYFGHDARLRGGHVGCHCSECE
jgi:uncharacterized ParB-like nuclease family protein